VFLKQSYHGRAAGATIHPNTVDRQFARNSPWAYLRGELAGSFRLSKNQKNRFTSVRKAPSESGKFAGRWTYPEYDFTFGVVSHIEFWSMSDLSAIGLAGTNLLVT
jgi:hypothetical protein